MKGKNWVVSLLAAAIVLPVAEVLLINIEEKSASIFEVEIEIIVSSNDEEKEKDKEPCPSTGGSIVCPTS